MTFQASVNINQGFGVVGDIFKNGPTRAQPGIIDSVGSNPTNTIGRVFTQVPAADGHATVGGAGSFYGILANSKTYPSYGNATGTLAPTLNLPQYANGEFVYDTTGIIVTLPAAANVNDLVDFKQSDGTLVTRPESGSVTASITSNVMTVTVADAGGAQLAVGQKVTTAAGTSAVIESLGTGTGGTGTYNLSTIADASSGAVGFNTSPASGNSPVPGFRVKFYSISAAGLAVIGVTN